MQLLLIIINLKLELIPVWCLVQEPSTDSLLGGKFLSYLHQPCKKYWPFLNMCHYLIKVPWPGSRFSKDPVTYRARKVILEIILRLSWKVALLICLRWKKEQNNCQVSKHETCSYRRYKEIFGTRKVSGLSRNGPLVMWNSFSFPIA